MKTYRIFSFLAYDNSDNLSFSNILNLINKNNFSYFYIYHNNDNNKSHYHIAIYLPEATTITNISKKLNIETNYIKVLDDFGKRYTLKNTIKYFLHLNDKNKFQYDITELKTNQYDILEKYYTILTTNEKDEKLILDDILLFIENNKPTCTNLLHYCIDNNYLKVFKKYSYFLNQITKENLYN